MDGNYGQNQNWQDSNQSNQGWQDANQPNQSWQDPNQPNQNWQDANQSNQSWQDPNQFSQNWQDPNQPNQNWQNQNTYYNGYNNGQQNNGYPNMNGYPNPNMPDQGYANNGAYNNYMPNNYNGPIVVANAVPTKGGGLAVGSLVCGIISILGFWSMITVIVAIVGVVLGAVNNAQDNPNKGMAIAGIILNIIGFLLSIFFIIILMEI